MAELLKYDLTISVEEEVLQVARRRAEAMGTSVNQLVRELLLDLAGMNRRELTDVLASLSNPPRGNSSGCKFVREELHERR